MSSNLAAPTNLNQNKCGKASETSSTWEGGRYPVSWEMEEAICASPMGFTAAGCFGFPRIQGMVSSVPLLPATSSGLELQVKSDHLADTEATMKIWWWVSVPYSIVFPVFAILSNSWYVTHVLTAFFVLSWITALSSAIWTLATLIIRRATHNIPRTKDGTVMLALGVIASLWLLQPLGALKWLTVN